MSSLIPLLLDALGAGSLRIEVGRIQGRCGYLDPDARTITLNPDARPEEIAAELGDQLRALAAVPLPRTPSDDLPASLGRPALTLVQADDRARARDDTDRRHPRVVI